MAVFNVGCREQGEKWRIFNEKILKKKENACKDEGNFSIKVVIKLQMTIVTAMGMIRMKMKVKR